MPKAKPTVSERLNRAIELKTNELAVQYNQETDPKRKIDLKYRLGRTLMGNFVNEIMNLSDEDFGRSLHQVYLLKLRCGECRTNFKVETSGLLQRNYAEE